MDVNLRQVRAFLAVVSAGGFTRAAELLHISQPALTIRVKQLEDQVGLKLIDRSSRALELTPEGREIHPVFQKIIRDFDAAIADIKAYTHSELGILRIAALPSFCTGPLASLFVEFKQRNPKVTFVLKDAVGRRIGAMVRAEEVDFGVGVQDALEADLDYVPLCEDRLMLVCPAGHALDTQKSVGLHDIAAFPIVALTADTSVRRMVDAAFEAKGLALNPACEATYMATAVSMVRAGLGVTLLPSSAVEINLYNDIAARQIGDLDMIRKIFIIRRRGVPLRPQAQAMFDALLAAPLPAQFGSASDLGYRSSALK